MLENGLHTKEEQDLRKKAWKYNWEYWQRMEITYWCQREHREGLRELSHITWSKSSVQSTGVTPSRRHNHFLKQKMKSDCELRVHRLDERVSNICVDFSFPSNQGHVLLGLRENENLSFDCRVSILQMSGPRKAQQVNWSGCWWQFQTCLTSRTRQNDRFRCQVENWASGIVSSNVSMERKHST